MAYLVRELLIEIGEDPEREGLLKTPQRVARSLAFLTRGYRQAPQELINNAVFESSANNMIITRDADMLFDLIILDPMLPGMDGLEVCRALERDPNTEDIPIVMPTAGGEDADIVAGLEPGTDNYIQVPPLAYRNSTIRRPSVNRSVSRR